MKSSAETNNDAHTHPNHRHQNTSQPTPPRTHTHFSLNGRCLLPSHEGLLDVALLGLDVARLGLAVGDLGGVSHARLGLGHGLGVAAEHLLLLLLLLGIHGRLPLDRGKVAGGGLLLDHHHVGSTAAVLQAGVGVADDGALGAAAEARAAS